MAPAVPAPEILQGARHHDATVIQSQIMLTLAMLFVLAWQVRTWVVFIRQSSCTIYCKLLRNISIYVWWTRSPFVPDILNIVSRNVGIKSTQCNAVLHSMLSGFIIRCNTPLSLVKASVMLRLPPLEYLGCEIFVLDRVGHHSR
jgi:hypothetical protein